MAIESKITIPKEKGITTYLTHNFHSYPAKFVPQIPNYFITKLTSEKDVVLDPFVGCGTTMVECKLLNRNGIGVDLNPIATLVSSAKVNELSEDEITEINIILNRIRDSIKLFLENNNLKLNIPEFYNRDHWFQSNVQKELTIIINEINKIKNDHISIFLKTAFSSIIVTVSNQESDTRYAAKNKSIDNFQTYTTFEKKVKSMLVRIKEFNLKSTKSEIKIYNKDARELHFISDNSVDLVVTSPPYANTYDYYLYHKLRMYWLNYDVSNVKKMEIGSRDKHSSQKKDISDFNNNIKLCFKEVVRVLKPEKHVIIVIGDSIIRKEFFNAKEMMIKMGKEIGLEFINSSSEKLKKTTRMFNPKFTNALKNEHIMIFKNMKNVL